MVGRDTQWRLAMVLADVAAHERDLAAIRHSLMHIRPFDPFAAFQLLDRRAAGFFCGRDLQSFCQRNQVALSPFESQLILRKLDKDLDGKVSYSEFLEATGSSQTVKLTEREANVRGEEIALMRLFICEKEFIVSAQKRKEEMMRAEDFSMRGAFRVLDGGDKGAIESQDLAAFFQRLGFAYASEDIRRVFQVLDRDRDGKINFTDFVEALMLGEELVSSSQTNTAFRTSLRPSLSESRLPRNSASASLPVPRAPPSVTEEIRTRADKQPFDFEDFLQLQVDAVRSLEEKKQNLVLKADFHPLALFQMFDARNEGKISAISFAEGLQFLGLSVSPHESFSLLKRFDLDCDGRLSPEEFSSLFRPHSPNFSLMLADRRTTAEVFAYDTTAALLSLFQRYFDLSKLISTAQIRFEETIHSGISAVFSRLARNNSGFFTEDDLRTALEQSGSVVSQSELRTLMRFYDGDKTGQVRFDRFVETLAPLRPPRVR